MYKIENSSFVATEKRETPAGTEIEIELPPWLDAVRSQVESIRFGQVQIVVHDSRVVQIEKVEKIRFDSKATAI